MDTLDNHAHGAYLVQTQTATYVINTDTMTLHRGASELDAAALRRDGELVTIVSLLEVTVGRPMDLIINLHLPGVACTRRLSTPVRSITRIDTRTTSEREA